MYKGRQREREFRGGNRRRGRGSILHGQRTISMHEAHWSYSFLSTQNTYLHFGLCTGVSLLVFHVHLSSSSCFSISLSLSLSLSSVHILVIRLTVSILVHYSRFLGSSSLSLYRKPLFVLLLLALYSSPFLLPRALDSVFLYSRGQPPPSVGVSTLTRLHTGRSAGSARVPLTALRSLSKSLDYHASRYL